MTDRKPFEFDHSTITIESAVYQALGAASMAWSKTPAGVFDDVHARNVAEALLRKIEELSPKPVGHHPADFGDEARAERAAHPLNGYDAKHDDEHGTDHLIVEAYTRAARAGSQARSPISAGGKRRQLVVAASLLWAAADRIERNP